MTAHDLDGALTAASNACHQWPALPQAHYAYGEAWLAQGHVAQAERAFAAALQHAPGWAEAWVSYGVCRYRQGAVEDAKTAMRQALRAVPGHPTATSNLGAFLRITGEVEGAEALLSQSVEAVPDNIGARLNLAADMLMEDRTAEALALLEGAASLPTDLPALRHFHLLHSLALLQLGRAAEARLVLDALAALGAIPAEIAPLWHWRHLLLAMAEDDRAEADRRADLMESALASMGPAAVSEHRIMGHYELANFRARQGDHAATFAQWAAGHAVLRGMQPFSRADHEAYIDASIAVFTKARFASGPIARNTDPAPVFIVGMPRSGTTLCHQILASHAQGHGAGERQALGPMFVKLAGYDDAASVHRLAALDAGALDAAAESYLEALHALAPGKTRIVDKLPANYLNLSLAGLLMPGARIIHCVRDPRDIGLSIFSHRFHGYQGYAHDLADLGWTIAQQHRLMEHWKAALPNPILTVKLSDWVEDFDATLARVLAHLDLPHDPNCARFYEAEGRVRTASRAQVRLPVNASGLGRWRRYETELQPLIAELDKARLLDAWRATATPQTENFQKES